MSNAQSEEAGADAGCEEVILQSLTNGAQDIEDGTAEYLEEHDPMAQDDGDVEAVASTPTSKHKRKIQQQSDDGGEEADEVEEADGSGEQNGGENDTAEENEEVEEEIEEEGEEEIEEVEEEMEPRKPHKPTPHPKKRKDAALLAQTDEEEQPTSSGHAARIKDNIVDEKQCRVCTTKEDLVSLFKTIEQQTIADMLMTICPTVSIALKDFMPQFICSTCLDNVTTAVQLKTQCETTERELRKKLSRSKNKVRRPRGYVVIDATADSDPSEDEEPNDDVEFKVSDEVSASAGDDSEDSDFSSKKKKPVRGTGGRGRGRRKSAPMAPIPKEKKRMGRPPKKRPPTPVEISDDENDNIEKIKRKKRKLKQESPEEEKPTEFPCDECEQVFTRKLSLVLHKKAHSGARVPINCEICGQQFKIQGAYRKHVQRHNDEPSGFECNKCEQVLNTKSELKRHLADEHGDKGMVYECEKCKRQFVSQIRFERHQDGRCPGHEVKPKQRHNDADSYTVGKDLFKSVAPLTTTYWSDSFSD